jgi:hypothetical protein
VSVVVEAFVVVVITGPVPEVVETVVVGGARLVGPRSGLAVLMLVVGREWAAFVEVAALVVMATVLGVVVFMVMRGTPSAFVVEEVGVVEVAALVAAGSMSLSSAEIGERNQKPGAEDLPSKVLTASTNAVGWNSMPSSQETVSSLSSCCLAKKANQALRSALFIWFAGRNLAGRMISSGSSTVGTTAVLTIVLYFCAIPDQSSIRPLPL